MTKAIDTSVAGLRREAMELDLIAFSKNSGWLTRAAEVINAAADRIEELEGRAEK